MKFLAINTAGDGTLVVAVNDNKTAYVSNQNFKQASEIIIPNIDEALKKVDLTVNEVDFICCVIGPGSFTGIRIGVSTARAFAYACNKPCVAVNYLSVMAHANLNKDTETIISIADGSNGTAYVAVYDNKYNEIFAPHVIPSNDLNTFLATVDEPYVVVGDTFAEKKYNAINCSTDANALIKCAMHYKDNKINYTRLIPLYIRVSQAEKDLNEKEKQC